MKNPNKVSILWFLVKMMNENWIQASRNIAHRPRSERALQRFEYLDIMGLFETGWMVFDHKWGGHEFGYPRNE